MLCLRGDRDHGLIPRARDGARASPHLRIDDTRGNRTIDRSLRSWIFHEYVDGNVNIIYYIVFYSSPGLVLLGSSAKCCVVLQR